MSITFAPYDRSGLLLNLFKKLVQIVKYDNQYCYVLLKKASLNKTAVIQLDEVRISLSSIPQNDYLLLGHPDHTHSPPAFKCTSQTLMELMAGLMTIDTAITKNKLEIRGSLEEVLNIYDLTLALLTESSINHRIRALWQEFINSWTRNSIRYKLVPINHQRPRHDTFISLIPEHILKIGLNSE